MLQSEKIENLVRQLKLLQMRGPIARPAYSTFYIEGKMDGAIN